MMLTCFRTLPGSGFTRMRTKAARVYFYVAIGPYCIRAKKGEMKKGLRRALLQYLV